jgi:hypothetical protein
MQPYQPVTDEDVVRQVHVSRIFDKALLSNPQKAGEVIARYLLQSEMPVSETVADQFPDQDSVVTHMHSIQQREERNVEITEDDLDSLLVFLQ